MSFRLLIECSKEISELHINFTDGTSVVKSSDEPSEPKAEKPKRKPEKTEHLNKTKESVQSESVKDNNYHNYLDVDAFDEVKTKSAEIIKPEIPDKSGYKVAEELQNLDI